jgi:hypothetical protein
VKIVRLRPLNQRLGFGAGLAHASTALALGDSATAVEGFLREDYPTFQDHVYHSGRQPRMSLDIGGKEVPLMPPLPQSLNPL